MDEDYEPRMQYAAAGSGLALAAFILDIISCVAIGFSAVFVWYWYLVALCWMIPMTVMSYQIYKGDRPNSVAFGVCTLLFLDVISGILLLCAPKDEVIDSVEAAQY